MPYSHSMQYTIERPRAQAENANFAPVRRFPAAPQTHDPRSVLSNLFRISEISIDAEI